MTGSIVLNVCAECGVTAEEFFGNGRTRKLADTRKLAISQLREAGFSSRAIARLIRRNYSTIQYWSYPEYRARRKTYYKNYHLEHPTPRHKWISEEQKRRLLEVYLKEGFAAAKPIAISYGIKPAEISRYSRAIGVKGKPGRPKPCEIRA
jgi:IS30 family transposase